MAAYDHPVIELIRQRAQESSLPNSRRDPYKLALCIEGGGLRGVVPAGMVTALELLGLKNVFDVVYGASAGSSTAAYFLAGEARRGTTIYYEKLTDHRFINYFRPFVGKPIVNLDYLFYDVMVESVPLPWERVVSSMVPLKVLSTSVANDQTQVFSSFATQKELLSALNASARVPVLAGIRPLLLEGGRYWDAGLLDVYALRAAVSDGCTHILSLRSRPRGLPLREMNNIEVTFVALAAIIETCSLSLPMRIISRNNPAGNYGSFLEQSVSSPGHAPFLYDIALGPDFKEIRRWETDSRRLKAGAIAGVRAALSAFGLHDVAVDSELAAFDRFGHRIGRAHLASSDLVDARS